MSSSSEQAARLPRHVAIVMDGNGRWARARHLPRTAGHKRGVEATRGVIRGCARRGIEALTLFAFSSENWRRPREEVSTLMDLFLVALRREISALHENGVRLRFIGDRSAFSARLREQIEQAEALTAENTGLKLQIAANYGGQWDILQAARALAQRVAEGALSVDDIDEACFEQALSTHDLPQPDLFIRTGGEQRISNFLLWQIAYAELWFTPVLWPDFDDTHLQAALEDFAGRQRRFGLTGEQAEQQHA
ncbi:MAG: di-trans,poly-cis-decaprenylcistransferase [Gammaproteobacteria bacterium]|nr:MAG: di-trans,poly-cis-decaprenylcistransferase [Gammaproteobacteria bacterium]